MKLFIQIPCLNEAETLPLVVADLPRSIPGIDIIETMVIDDGSTDGTSDIARALGVNHILRHESNRGLAAAFMTGIKGCLERGADIIVNTDGDNQYPGRFIAHLVQPILNGTSEIVIGDRCPGEDQKNTLFKRCLYRLGSVTLKHALRQDVPDPVSGFRAISKYAAEKIDIREKFSYTLEMLLKAVAEKTVITFVPVETNKATRPSRLCRNSILFVARSSMILARFKVSAIRSMQSSKATSFP